MAFRQHYWTSTQTAAKSGFQVKAQSPDIPQVAAQMINKMIGYKMPTQADPEAFRTHPIALRYLPLTSGIDGDAILSCIQSSGADEYGRPGNYFAHSITGPIAEFNMGLPPIAYWHSEFWQMTAPVVDVSLPVTAAFEAVPGFVFGQVWAFLADKPRRDWFYRLLCAVIDNSQSGRRIIILDSTESVAVWIAALTMALPRSRRALFSFATYHHDPLSAPFLLIGTTRDGQFRFSTDDYVTSFVLNADDQRISDAPPSAYADYICDNFYEDQYENDSSETLDFFDWSDRRLGSQQAITPAFNDLAIFYQSAVKKDRPTVSARVVSAARGIMGTLTTSAADFSDLRAACDVFSDALIKNITPGSLQDFMKALSMLQAIDPTSVESCASGVGALAALVAQKRETEAAQLRAALLNLFSETNVRAAIQNSSLVEWLNTQLTPDSKHLTQFWLQFGSLLTVKETGTAAQQGLLQKTFEALYPQATSGIATLPSDAPLLINSVISALGAENPVILHELAALKKQYPDNPVTEWLFYNAVSAMKPEDRAEIRSAYQVISPQIHRYELFQDVTKAATAAKNGSQVLKLSYSWIRLTDDEGSRTKFLDLICSCAWPLLNQRDFSALLLADESIYPRLPETWRTRIIDVSLADALIELPNATQQRFYEQLSQYPDLPMSPISSGVVRGVLALIRRRMKEEDVSIIHKSLSLSAEVNYKKQVQTLFETFFVTKTVNPTHLYLIQATYVSKERNSFWELYWEHFKTALLKNRQTAETVAILNLWFIHLPALTGTRDYAAHEFFMGLPQVLETIRSTREYSSVGHAFEEQLNKMPWAALILKRLEVQRKGFIGGRLF